MSSWRAPVTAGGRFAVGTLVLCAAVTCDEGGLGAVLALPVAAVTALAVALCRSSLEALVPYGRNRGAGALFRFLSLWLEALSLLGACAVCARVLSACLDAMTGGKAKMMILGRVATPQEPWPDVIGVSIVMLVTGMFMLGLENSLAFTAVLLAGISGCTGLLGAAWVLRGDTRILIKTALMPAGWPGFFSSAALLTFTYVPGLSERPVAANVISGPGIGPLWRFNRPVIRPSPVKRHLHTAALFILPILMATGVILALSLLTEFRQFITPVPILHMLEVRDLAPLVPAASCFLVLALSTALVDLFPEIYDLLVKLAGPSWKLLARSLAYESQDSGSPVLAIFAAGSLCAILAFACPLNVLLRLTAVGTLLSGGCCAVELLLTVHKPIHSPRQEVQSVGYNRLPMNQNGLNKKSKKSSLWFLPRPKSCPKLNPNMLARVKPNKKAGEREREWLLLGEPPLSPTELPDSPCSPGVVESVLGSDAEDTADIPGPGPVTACCSDTDSSTDIDAIVDEYRQKVKVSTAGPMSGTLEVPTMSSWHRAVFYTACLCASSAAMSVAAILESSELFYCSATLILVFVFATCLVPRRPSAYLTSVIGPSALVLTTLLVGQVLIQTWPAVSMWILAGLIIFLRLDCCCSCEDELNSFPISYSERRIRVRVPPPGSLVSRLVTGHRTNRRGSDTVALNS